MLEDWKIYKLNNFCDKISVGFVGTISNHYTDKSAGVPILRSKNVRPGKIDYNDLEYVTREFHSKNKKSKLLAGDIVIVRVGQNRGDVCRVPDSFDELNVANCVFLRPPRDYSGYIEFYLRSPLGRQLLLSISSGSAQLVLNTGAIAELELPFPKRKEALAIASILSALDDKIELNLQMNKTLEEMAMALYKHWFVDFGPFQDGEFVDSELGEIPKGWEVKSIGDITKVVSKGTTPRQKDVDCLLESIPFLKVKDISNDGLIHDSKIELIPVEVHLKQLKRSILLEDDILFSIAGTIGRVSIVPKHLNNSNCNQALAFIRLSKEFSNNLTQVYYYFKSNEVQASINSSIVQGVQANVSLTVIKDLKIVIPTNELIKQFNLEVNNSFKLLRSNTIENQTLTQIRDTLLPKLISGEVRVKDVQQEIMEVL